MKRIFTVLLCVAALVFALALVSSAASTTSNAYADTFDTVDGVPVPNVIDADARAVVKVNDTYYTIPTYYLLADNSHFTWSVHENVKAELGLGSDVRKNLIRIEIPEGIVTSHESGSGGLKLEDATNLIEASLPSSLTLMGSHFFNRCSELTTVNGLENTKITKVCEYAFNGTKVSNISALPSTLQCIEANSFSGTSIVSLSVSAGVAEIQHHAFAGCKSLTTITFEGTALESIGIYAFEKSTLTSFTFPNSTVALSEGIFNECYSLTTLVNFEKLNIESVPAKLFKGCPLTTLTLPSGITSIGVSAFHGHNISQEKLVIPNGVTTIGTQAFARTGTSGSNIQILVLPANLQTLTGNHVFEKIRATQVYIPSGLQGVAYQGIFNEFWTSGVAFYFTGSESAANTLKNNANTSSNEAFTNATVISLGAYNALSNAEKAKANYIVWGYNACTAFYGGEHQQDTNPCFIDCTRCGKHEADPNAVHPYADAVYSYPQGYASAGVVVVACTTKGCAHNVTPVTQSAPAIFELVGYATNMAGTKLTTGYKVNNEAYDAFYNSTGVELSYGVVAYAPVAGEIDCSPLKVENGAVALVDPMYTIHAEISKSCYMFDFIIRGFEPSESVTIAACAYVFDGKEIGYLCGNSQSNFGQQTTAHALTIYNASVTKPVTTTEE